MLALLSMGGFLYWAHSNPLYSDEEMIVRFQAHRTEIEALIKSYQEFRPSLGRVEWSHLPEIKELQVKAGVRRVHGGLPIWFPNPYSMEAARQFELSTEDDVMKYGLHARRPFHTIAIDFPYKNPNRTFASVLLPTGTVLIYKQLVYFPEVPKIENGILLQPASPRLPTVPSWPTPERVLPSLDEYPSNWKLKGECVFRQIEPQWFLQMCIATI